MGVGPHSHWDRPDSGLACHVCREVTPLKIQHQVSRKMMKLKLKEAPQRGKMMSQVSDCRYSNSVVNSGLPDILEQVILGRNVVHPYSLAHKILPSN